MYNKFLTALFFIVSLANSSQAAEAVINVHMHKISQNLHELMPYFVSEDKFADKSSESAIRQRLNSLINEFEKIKTHPAIKTPGFSLSRNLIEKNLKGVVDSFNNNQKNFARYKLNSTFGLCISCHTQLPTGDRLKLFPEISVEKIIPQTFELAEFYFITRDFKKALEHYNLFINSYPKNGESLKQLETALNRKLSYFTRIQRGKESEAILEFKENLKNSAIPVKVRDHISKWIEELAIIPKPITDITAYLKQLTSKNSHGPFDSLYTNQEVQDLRVSGQLYEYLNNNPDNNIIPEVLYNLAMIDKRLNYNIFYSLGDIYLQECIESYPKSPFAKKCYETYEEETIFSYTGSSGTHIPSNVKKELKRLKQKVESL